MSIVYTSESRTFTLSGGNTSYVLHIDDMGNLLGIYWGSRIPDGALKHDPAPYFSISSDEFYTTHTPWEIPTPGRGYYSDASLVVVNAGGDDTADLKYVSHTITPGKPGLEGLPATYTEEDGEAQTLTIKLHDDLTGITVEALYTMFEQSGALARSLRVVNEGSDTVSIEKIMSASTLLRGADWDIVHLKGAWARERNVIRNPLGEAEYALGSRRGASSQEENPFIALCEKSADEFKGEVYAMSLIYSGSFLATADVDNRENSRLSIGLNPDVFGWMLKPGESFQSPESVQVYSADGFNGMSQIYHTLYRKRLARGVWRDMVRPILINNWEGTYFDFNEEKILEIAKSAKELGIELFVLDDGWFGKRNIDNCSLGDWYCNMEKLPNGISGLSDRIHSMGMMFGLWFEPEMISPDSDLYRAHPDWCLHIEGRSRSEARWQLTLDMGREDVQEYLIDVLTREMRNGKLDYVKWDMNRNMAEAFSVMLEPECRFETQHRYILGLYRVLDTLVERFPNILFECCASGGGRFDPGMTYYMPQTWTSDDTDAVERLYIQYGTSFVYPASTMGAHVSAVPNHQTGRMTSMRMRGDVAIGGNFGFELDLSKMSEEDTKTARELVEQVKGIREITQKGTFTRLVSPFNGKQVAAWQFISEDESEALLCFYRILGKPNTAPDIVRMKGLDPNAYYTDDEGNIWSGAVLMGHGMWFTTRGDYQSKIVHLKKTEKA